MINPEQFINSSNAIPTLRYLLNLDINAVDEKFLKMGIANFIDLAQTKQLCFYVSHTEETPSQKTENLVHHAIGLSALLNDEAKKNLLAFLAINQSY